MTDHTEWIADLCFVTHFASSYHSSFLMEMIYFPHYTGTTTGISAHDRALTARKLAEGAPAHEFSRPGHMVPLRARDGGVLTRKGHTESAVGGSLPLIF